MLLSCNRIFHDLNLVLSAAVQELLSLTANTYFMVAGSPIMLLYSNELWNFPPHRALGHHLAFPWDEAVIYIVSLCSFLISSGQLMQYTLVPALS